MLLISEYCVLMEIPAYRRTRLCVLCVVTVHSALPDPARLGRKGACQSGLCARVGGGQHQLQQGSTAHQARGPLSVMSLASLAPGWPKRVSFPDEGGP